MTRTKHAYRTTSAVTITIYWADAFGHQTSTPTTMEQPAGCFVFRGSRRDFAEHLAKLNAEHGEGYAAEEVFQYA